MLVIAGRNFVGMTRTDLSKDRADYHHQIGGGFEKKSGEIYVPGSKLLILIYFGDGHPTFKDGNPFNANLLRHLFCHFHCEADSMLSQCKVIMLHSQAWLL